jgi:putative membrane protein
VEVLAVAAVVSAAVAVALEAAAHLVTGRQQRSIIPGNGMKEKIQKFLTDAERRQIEQKVREAEASTSGEIVVMAVGESSNYPSAIMAASGVISLVLAVGGSVAYGSENMWLFLVLFALFFIGANEAVRRIPALKRPFVSRAEIAEEVEAAAIHSFYHRKVHETRDRTGILIYISLYEHSVRVLADTGIDAKVGKQVWKGVVDTVTKGIREGQPGEGICSAVEQCGKLLSQHFPRKSDDLNELGDSMIIG